MEKKTSEILLPLFPLPLVLFPQMKLPLHIFEMRYREMIGNCIDTDTPFGVVLTQDQEIVNVGCSAKVVEVLKRFSNGEFDIMTVGEDRFRIVELFEGKAYLEGMVEFFRDDRAGLSQEDAVEQIDLLEEIFSLCYRLIRSDSKVEKIRDFTQSHSGESSFLLANHLGFDLAFQQQIIQLRSETERLACLVDYLSSIVGSESDLVGKGFLLGESWFNIN